jgi:uncharacterized repeat protein (TIGR01451 family)
MLACFETTAQCDSDAGTMSSTPIHACEGGTANASATTGAFLEPDDVLQYALHTNAGASLGTVISIGNTPSFGFQSGSMSLGTTYYISAIVGNDDGSGNVDLADPCLSVAAGTPVTWHVLPTATISGGGGICAGSGETVSLTISLTGQAPWMVTYQVNGVPQAPLVINSNPYSLIVGQASAGVITLLNVTDQNCSGTVSGSATVTVNTAPIVLNANGSCDPSNQFYTTTLEISGGNPASYVVNPPGSGTISGNIFISNPIPTGQPYSFEVDDANGCGPLVVSGTVTCNCVTSAGSMDPTPIIVDDCNSGAVTGLYNDTSEAQDANDTRMFVLHTSPSVALGTIIQTNNNAPDFYFDPANMSFGVTYYLSAVVGNDDGSGGVDFTDPCMDVAAGTPVIFNANPLVVTISPPVACPGEQLTMTILAIGGTPPYLYDWQGPGGWTSDEPNPVLPEVEGVYTVTVTDANSCSTSITFTLVIPEPIVCDLTVDGELSCQNADVNIGLSCIGGTFPWAFIWNTGETSLSSTVSQPGTYTVTITDSNGCSVIESVEVTVNPDECGVIRGTVSEDVDGACLFDAGDQPLANWMVKATSGTDEFFAVTNASGEYEIFALPGDYEVAVILPPNGYWLSCEPFLSVTLEDATDVDTANFALEKLADCPLLEVDISTAFWRRCFTNTNYVSYCNLGTADATDAYVELTFDPLMSVTSASIPFSGPVNGVYTFEIGDVPVGECGNFSIQTLVSCNAVLGQTLCSEAHIFPDSLCVPTNPLWSGAFIEITQECTADSVIFTIQNTGAGDMTEPVGFIVVEDGVMLMQGTNEVTLQAGEAISISFPANGSTYAIIAGQVENAPGQSSPLLTVEACGTNGVGSFSTGFVTQFPENDADPFVSIDCHEVIGSFDPNDKNGFPKGFGDDRLIEPGQALDYHIRFQNTGTDTAFTVVIEDVIAPELDLATLRPGASSHPYKLEIRTDTMVFIFENILLPDSNVNEPASHGFVKFRIGQKPGPPLGTVIENEAAIFFDFNDPIITNTTLHRLGEPFKLTDSRELFLKKFNCLAFPNPFSKTANIIVQGAENETFDLHLYDLTGRRLRSQVFTGGFTQIHRDGLPPGLYFYEIKMNGVRVGQGKVAVE